MNNLVNTLLPASGKVLFPEKSALIPDNQQPVPKAMKVATKIVAQRPEKRPNNVSVIERVIEPREEVQTTSHNRAVVDKRGNSFNSTLDEDSFVNIEQLGPSESSSTITENNISQHLKKIPVIRIGIGDGAGMGDQVASISIMENLIKLGFQGRIEFIYKAENKDDQEKLRTKLACLIPQFDKKCNHIQRLMIKNRTCIIIPHSKFESYCRQESSNLQQPLGFWPMNFNRSWLKVDYGIVIPPFGWNKTKARIERPDTPSKPVNLPAMANYQLEYKPLSSSHMAEQMEIDSRGTSLLEIIRACNTGLIQLMPVYGIHHLQLEPSHDLIVQRLGKAAASTHDSAQDQTILLILSPLEDTKRLQYAAITAGFTYCDLRSQSWSPDDSRYKPGTDTNDKNVQILYCGPVPKAVFETICFTANLPLIQEGANSASFMHQVGKAYLPLLPKGDTSLPKPPDNTERELEPPAEKRRRILSPCTMIDDHTHSRIERLANSMTSRTKDYSLYTTATDLWNKLRKVLTDTALHAFKEEFGQMVTLGSFSESYFRKSLLEAISYSCKDLDEDEKVWLRKIELLSGHLNKKSPRKEIEALKKQIIDGWKRLKGKGINVECILAYRTSGLPLSDLRKELSIFRRISAPSGSSLICPTEKKVVPDDLDICEIVGDTCDNLDLLIPALHKRIQSKPPEHIPENAENLENGLDSDLLLLLLQQRIFDNDVHQDETIKLALCPPSVKDEEELVAFIKGEFGTQYFKELQYLAQLPENNSILCALALLEVEDWEEIHSKAKL